MNAFAASENVSMAEFVRAILNRKWLVLVLMALVVGTTAVVTFFMPKWYSATAMIRVDKPDEEVAVFSATRPTTHDPYFVQEQLQIISSKKILHPVIEKMDLPRVFGTLYNQGEPLTVSQCYLLLSDRRMLDVSPAQQMTSLINVKVWVLEDPLLAAQIANQIVETYRDDRVEFAVSAQNEGIRRLEEELQRQADVVKAARDRVEKLRHELGVSGVDINSRQVGLEIEGLRSLESSLIQLRVETIGRKTRWERFREIPAADRLGLVNSEIITDPNIKNLLQTYLSAEQQLTRLQGQLGGEHPELKAALENVTKISSQLDGLLGGYEKALEMSYLEANARLVELETQIGQARSEQMRSATDVMRPFDDAVKRLQEEERFHESLKLSLRQRQIDYKAPKKSVEILSPAEPSTKPGRPNMPLNLLLAGIAGVILSLGIALVVEMLDTSFRSVSDIETRLGLPVLGVIGRDVQIVDKSNYDTFVAEPYRVIQANLELAAGEAVPRCLVVQSAGPGEGKSTTLRNLAASMALSGLRVLLIDSDLRRPSQHRIAGLERSPGLGDYFGDNYDGRQIIRPTAVPGLDIITAGVSGYSLTHQYKGKLDTLVKGMLPHYDRILLDSPPVIGVSDSSLLASMADGVVFVVQHKRNPQDMTSRARAILEKIDRKIYGVVLNQVPSMGSADFNYYTSNYDYYSSGRPQAKSSPAPQAGKPQTEQMNLRES